MTRATGSRLAAAAAALLALGGCLSTQSGPETTRAIAVTSRNVTILGPAGFCVDRQGSSSRGDSAFVVLGSCAAIGGEPTLPRPDVPVVLTAAVARGRAVSPRALEAYFRAHMAAQPGGPVTKGAVEPGLKVLDVAQKDGVVYLHSRDGAQPGTWRGILGIGPDVTVTLRLRMPPGVKVSPATQLATLHDFADQILRANAGRILVAAGT